MKLKYHPNSLPHESSRIPLSADNAQYLSTDV